MVHKKSSRELLDHIGWDLLHVTFLWKNRFDRKMAQRGYPWHSEARGRLLRYIGYDGISQATLAEQTDISRQAVQQLLDELQRDGAITRNPDPDDARKKVIQLTAFGRQVVGEANLVKEEIEAEYKSLLGEDRFLDLKESLEAIMELKEEDR